VDRKKVRYLITHYKGADMIRWDRDPNTFPPQRWQPRAQILRAHLDSLSPDELRRVRPDYYWLRYGQKAWIDSAARKANFNPNQPRVPAGNPDGGQWTSEGGGINDPRAISDATPDNDWKPGAQYAAGPRGPRDRLPPLPHISGVGEGARTYRPGQVTIVNNAQTGFSAVDETTEQLRKTLEKVVNARGEGYGPEYGKAIHTDFGNAVKSQNLSGIRVEHTYPEEMPYGSKGTIRTDIVLRNEIGEVKAIYDVKTGKAYLDAARVRALRVKTKTGPGVPVIEMHISRGLSLKARQAKYFWVITLRLWNPWIRGIAGRRIGRNSPSR
jgi:hypothetical protein